MVIFTMIFLIFLRSFDIWKSAINHTIIYVGGRPILIFIFKFSIFSSNIKNQITSPKKMSNQVFCFFFFFFKDGKHLVLVVIKLQVQTGHFIFPGCDSSSLFLVPLSHNTLHNNFINHNVQIKIDAYFV